MGKRGTGGDPGLEYGAANAWQGNYWSDYAGLDADGDGAGDTPYRSERLFENLIDRVPSLRALLYSPAAQTVEFAASAFPIVRPQPKLADPAPRTQPASIPARARAEDDDGGAGMVWAGLLLLGLAAGCGAAAGWGDGAQNGPRRPAGRLSLDGR